MPPWLPWLPWLLVAEAGLLYLVQARSHRKRTEPIVRLSAEGVAVDTPGTHLGLIRWDEIEDVRCYTLMYRFVGIVPRNMGAISSRLGRRGWLVTLNAACVPLYKPFGVFAAPINIPEAVLPVGADELLARIQTSRAAHAAGAARPPGLDQDFGAGVWPPPPRSR